AQKAQASERDAAEEAEQSQLRRRPANGDAEDEDSEAQDEGRLEEEEHDPRKHLSEQEMRFAHGRGRHELQGLPNARVDNRVSDPPDARREEVQADQPRKEKVDV